MTVEQYIPNDKPSTPKKSANSNESQTTTLDIPSKMIEEQHQAVVEANKDSSLVAGTAAKVGFVSLGCLN